MVRLSHSHIRIGTFQYFAARGEIEALRLLTDHVIARHYPAAAAAEPSPYRALLDAVIARQAAPDPTLWRLALEACAEACRACGAECAKHGGKFGHCRICRDACARCEQACREVLKAYPTGGTAQARH
jgi:hypothetical protein